MGYELAIRKTGEVRAVEEAPLVAALSAAVQRNLAAQKEGAPPLPSGTAAPEPRGTWTLANGFAKVLARLARDGETTLGLDVEIPMGGSEAELRDAFGFALKTASELGLVVFDPQLGREVSKEAEEDVVTRWREARSWSLDIAGTAEDVRAIDEGAADRPLFGTGAKVLLGIILALVVGMWAMDALIARDVTPDLQPKLPTFKGEPLPMRGPPPRQR